MIVILLLLGLLVVLSVVGLVRELRLDQPAEIPRSRFVDPDLQPPSRRRSPV